MTNEIVTHSRPESNADRILRDAAAQAVAEFRRRGLPRAGLLNFCHGSWQVAVSQHPELAPLRSRFVALVTEPFADNQHQMFGQGTR